MSPEACERQLREALAGLGTTVEAATPAQAWRAFLDVCGPLVPSEEIGLLVQWGTYDWSGTYCYSFSLVCQFPDPECDEYIQVNLALTREVDPGLGHRNSKNWWSWDHKTLSDLVEDVEIRETFYEFMRLGGWKGQLDVCGT